MPFALMTTLILALGAYTALRESAFLTSYNLGNLLLLTMPLAFIGVVVLAVLADVWLYRTRTGLALRAVGLDETSSRRLGMGTGRTVILAFVVCSVLASIAGFYLAAEVQIGSPIIGNYALETLAAAVPGGASLAGGRGAFFGTLLAAPFLTLLPNVLALLNQPTEHPPLQIRLPLP